MTKEERIEQFLLSWLYYKNNNPNLLINGDVIYKSLTRYGVSSSDIKLDASLNGNFDKWINDFANQDNIRVFVDPKWEYFCQFVNKPNQVSKTGEQIKVYIPLDGAHLTYGVERIFDFLEKNDIPHASKVGKNVRFDDVVVRLSNPEDAEKLADYVRNDAYIQEGLIKCNPFAVSKEGIAYACDKRISFNSTVASLISIYLNDAYDNGKNVSVSDFRSFVLDYYNEAIVNTDSHTKLFDDMNVSLGQRNNNYVYNYMRVVELLYNSMDPNFTYDDYLEHYNKNNSNYYRKPELPVYTRSNKEYISGQTEPLVDEKEEKVYELMKMSLIQFGKKKNPDGTRKYSNDDAVAQIAKYFTTGDAQYITNSGGLRMELVNNDFRNKLTDYVSKKGISFGDVLLETKKRILDDALGVTCDKYGRDCKIDIAIKKVLLDDDYTGFTRTNGARENMEVAISAKDISDIIMKEMNYPPNVNIMSFSKDERNSLINNYVDSFKLKKYNQQDFVM